VIEIAGQPIVTVAADGAAAPFLRAELEGTLISTNARDGQGIAQASELRLQRDRSDEGTAAYLLQNWMQRL
jgi:hypothetical protein